MTRWNWLNLLVALLVSCLVYSAFVEVSYPIWGERASTLIGGAFAGLTMFSFTVYENDRRG